MEKHNSVIIGQRVLLNVGGRIYETERFTLLRGVEDGKESYFHALLRNFEKMSANQETVGPLWIDRDGEMFAVVLAWLRNPCPAILHSIRNLEQLRVEADYFLLPLLVAQIDDIMCKRKIEADSREQRKVQHAFLGGLWGVMLLGLASAAAWYYQKSRQQTSSSEPIGTTSSALESVEVADVAELNERISAGMWTLHKRA